MKDTIRKLLSVFAYAMMLIALAMMSACGSDGDSEVKTNDGTVTTDSGGDNKQDDDETTNGLPEEDLYLVLQVQSSDSSYSSHSNEVQFTSSPGDTVTISWHDPTRRVNNNCLMQSDIADYRLRYGTEENSYSVNKMISKTGDRGLICQPTATVDGSCGSVYKCDYSFEINENVNA